MIQLLELTFIQANIIAVALPIILLCIFILVIPTLRNGSGGRIRRYLSYLVNPPRMGPAASEGDSKDEQGMLWREDKVKLFFLYIGAILFLTSFMISEFYEVILDLVLPVTQGSTGEMREVVSVVFQSPFNAGWVGSLPWIGRTVYHETWNWIYVTAALTDNPDFFGTMMVTLMLFSIGVGLVFLTPLASKTIRHSFLPSMFFFTTAMACFTKAAVSCLAYGFALAVLNIELEYLTIVVSGGMYPGLALAIGVVSLIVLAMFGLFIYLGRRLWRFYYTDARSGKWFTRYIMLSFLLGFVITILVV